MKATAYIWKYRAAGNYLFANYFLNPVFYDKIKVSDIPPDGIPIYNEQLEKSDEILEFTAGDFDVKLSLLGACQSSREESLKDFLLPDGDRNFFYLCIVEFGDESDPAAKRVGGKIELNSISADLTEPKNRYDISFTVTGMIKELSVLQEKIQLQPLQQPLTIDMFISGCIIPDPHPQYLGFISRLNWEQRLGFEPVLMWEVYNDIISRGIGKGKWSVFKELVRGFGFMFKMSVFDRANIFDADYPEFLMEVFWRSEGLREVVIYRKSAVEKYSDLNTNKNYFVITHRSNILNNAVWYSGMLAVNDGGVYIADGLINPLLELVEFEENSGAIITVLNGQNPPVVAAQASTVVHLPTYSTQYLFNTEGVTNNLMNAQFSFMSLFCRRYTHFALPNQSHYVIVYGVKDILEKTIGKECNYFIRGIKKMSASEIVLDTNNNVNVYDTTIIGNKKYYCRAIKDSNILNETSMTEWVEC